MRTTAKLTTFRFMEYADGLSLAKHVKKYWKMAEEEAKNAGRQVLKGLAYLHEQQIVHRVSAKRVG